MNSLQKVIIPKQRGLKIVTIILLLLLLGSIATLHILIQSNTNKITQLEEQIVSEQQGIQQILENTDFTNYKANTQFLKTQKVVTYSQYIRDLFIATPASITITNISLQNEIDNTKVLQVALESQPALPEVSSILKTFEDHVAFDRPYISTIHSTRDKSGNTVYSLPLSLTLNIFDN